MVRERPSGRVVDARSLLNGELQLSGAAPGGVNYLLRLLRLATIMTISGSDGICRVPEGKLTDSVRLERGPKLPGTACSVRSPFLACIRRPYAHDHLPSRRSAVSPRLTMLARL